MLYSLNLNISVVLTRVAVALPKRIEDSEKACKRISQLHSEIRAVDASTPLIASALEVLADGRENPASIGKLASKHHSR